MAWKNDQVSERETAKILELARSVLGVQGDFVEFGCYAGDTSLMLAELLGEATRLWLYDSFEGLPEKSSQDASEIGKDFVKGALMVSKKDVKARFLRAGLAVPIIKKAWFNELTEQDVPDKIAFAFLDGDLYESIWDSLRLVGPKMVDGGVMVVHDYTNPALPGVAKAVDEWLAAGGKGRKIERFESMAIIM